MEDVITFFQHYGPLTLPKSLLLVAILLTSYLAHRLLLAVDQEAPIEYSIPVPEQCSPRWEGRILDDPKVKAGLLQTVQSEQ